jgi:hypothetical protein
MARMLFCHVVPLLLLGAMLYALHRPERLTMFKWFEWME